MKPSAPCFDRKWRAACEVRRCNRRDADALVKAHYLNQWPAQTMLVLGLYKGSDLLGVVTFSPLHRSVAARFGVNAWELSRLFITDKVPQNAESYLIGQAIKHIKREHPELDTLVSFADPKHGHSGVIYKATNWSEVGHGSKHLFTYRLKG